MNKNTLTWIGVALIVIISGVFGAMMEVGLINDGPVTIFIDSRNRE